MTRDILKNFKTSEHYSSFNDCSLPLAKMKNNSRLKIGLKGKQMDLVNILAPRKNRKRTEFKEGTLKTFFHTSWKMLHYLSVGSGIQLSENLRRLETFINYEVQKEERNWNIFHEFEKIFMLLQNEADSLLMTKEEFKDDFRMQDYMNCKIRQTVTEWLLLAMATYKDVQEKIHEATQERRISWLPVKYLQLSHIHPIIKKQRSTLIYVKAAILELLRWRPPFPLSVMGVTSTNIVLDGYFIPKDSLMIANTWSILHNYECWGDDADVYNPERFLNRKKNSEEECLLSSFAGKRLSLNKSLVQADILMNFLDILHKFNVSLPDGKPADLEGELFMSLQPKEQELILTLKN
ncbi:Cytochrome P450 2U1 [Araneus ventricosus]|uniref:Cytochrome P450 2U1 n=1 Tax=Araneus ventricosus TaxID=182803 RepID=A0A4Y2KYW2_ARAVE|nr:Cytochrome P450 2U1 [Araneus ventricosus]